MFKKLVMVAIVVGSVLVAYIILFATHDFVRESSNIAASGTGASNMTGFVEIMNAAPWWMLGIPGLVGVIVVVLILRAPEQR